MLRLCLADTLIEAGESGSYDFMFIDADKVGYDAYYELGLKLVRTGGIIAIDNVSTIFKQLGKKTCSRHIKC